MKGHNLFLQLYWDILRMLIRWTTELESFHCTKKLFLVSLLMYANTTELRPEGKIRKRNKLCVVIGLLTIQLGDSQVWWGGQHRNLYNRPVCCAREQAVSWLDLELWQGDKGCPRVTIYAPRESYILPGTLFAFLLIACIQMLGMQKQTVFAPSQWAKTQLGTCLVLI